MATGTKKKRVPKNNEPWLTHEQIDDKLVSALNTAKGFIGSTPQYKSGDVGASNAMRDVTDALKHVKRGY